MKYMLLTYLDEKAWAALSEAEQQRLMLRCDPHVRNLLKSGKFLGGSPLHPTATATTVQLQDGRRMVTDGPFAETREQLGGYTLLEADHLDDAIEIAAGFLAPEFPVTIEIRPIAHTAGVPALAAQEEHA
jgi:hypothetical protein